MAEGTRLRHDWMNDPRNVTIALLTITTLLLGGALGRERWGGVSSERRQAGEGEPVAVLDVVLDREHLGFIDFLLDRPVAEDRVGDVLGDAATIRPPLGGTWRWEGASVLRFEPAGGFEMATRYEFALVGERVLPPGRHLTGDSAFEIITDQFQVERVDTFQEPTPTGDAVVVRGTARFNYEVDPEALATRLRLVDPLRGDGDPVLLVIETYYEDRVVEFRSEPLQKQRQERELRLEISADLTPAFGNVPLTEEFETDVTIGSSERLAVWDIEPVPGDPESRLRIRMSSPVETAVAERFVSVEPGVPFRISSQRNELTLIGSFEPGSEYSLRIDAGLRARDGATLSADYAHAVRLPDMAPRLDFESPGMFLAASGQRRLAVDAVNTEVGDLVVERVYRNNLFYLFDSYGWMVWDNESYSGSAIAHSLGDRVAEVELRAGGARNRHRRVPVDLADYVDADEPGLYRVALARRGDYRAQQRWVMVTDLGVVAKQGEGEALIWVSSFATLRPVRDARVRLVSDQNQTIAEGVTDAAGLWRWRSESSPSERPYLVTVEHGADFSFLLFDAMRVDTTGLDVGGGGSSAAGYEAFLYGERDIYRPGETVTGVAVVRDRLLRAPPAMPLLLRHLDPTGLEIESTRLELAAGGVASFDQQVSQFARTGRHGLELLAGDRVIGRYGFQVEEFVPDRLRVRIESEAAGVAAGAALRYEVASNYLFGPPAAGARVETRVRLEATTFAPRGYDGYSFTIADRKYPGAEVFSADGRLDESGTSDFEAGLPAGLRVPSTLAAVITARASEEGGRGVTARIRVPVHPYPYYVGLRRVASGYAEPGVAERFAFVVLDVSGTPAQASTLRAELFKDEWQTVLRRTAAGTFRYESNRDSRLVETRTLAAGQRSGEFDLTAAEFGAYRVVVSDPLLGPAAEVEFTASGAGFSPWAIANPARIELELDQQEYRPGDRARLQVRAPFSGRLLVTAERDGIHWFKTYAMQGNTATIEVPVLEPMRPNAYLTATVIRSAGALQPGAVARAFGAVPIAVDRIANRLPVELTHVEQMRPGGPLEIVATTAPGAVVTLAAVDEGILQLTALRTPDPFDFFYRKLALGVSSFDTFSLLFPDVRVAGEGAAGGGEAASAMAQFVSTDGIRRAEPVAFWSGVLRADDSGRARVSFDVPSFQGALRVMAVAHDGRRFGSGEGSVAVRDPLVVLPTLPRFLATGDEVSVPVSVRNDTGTSGEITLRLGVALPGAPGRETTQQVVVQDGSEALAYFPVQVGGVTGNATFTIRADGVGEATTVTATLPVRADLPSMATESVGAIDDRVTELGAADAAVFRDGARRWLRIGRLPLVQFSGRLDELLRYPYGCLEQVTSAAFPLIYLDGLARQLDAELLATSGSPAAMVQDALRRLRSYQLTSGGFGLWPGSSPLQPWASVYATHFVVEARAAGFLVSDALHDRALDFVRDEVRARSDYAWDELQRVAYALYVLARAGQPDIGMMDFLRDRHVDSMRPESRALLAAGYAAVGDSSGMEELLAGLGEVVAAERQTGGNFDSPTRNRALMLMALQHADPGDGRIPDLARRLARDAATRTPWNTQETAFALLALGQFYSAQVARGDYSGRVLVAGQEVATFDSDRDLALELLRPGAVRVEMDAGFDGGAYYSLQTRGVPTEAGYSPGQDGIDVRRAFLTRSGRSADLDAVHQGDLLVVRIALRSSTGPLLNVVVQDLLPAGLEVENPRLSTSESLPWVTDADMVLEHLDLRDDRLLLFTSLPDGEWHTVYALVRAVSPGLFRLPPVQVEAMYEPEIRATLDRGWVRILRR